MDGIHDLGGMNGFGPVEVEGDEPVFHEPWEALAFALNVLGIGALRTYNADEYRHAVERMDPGHYLEAPYYERVSPARRPLCREGHRHARRARSARRRLGSARGRWPPSRRPTCLPDHEPASGSEIECSFATSTPLATRACPLRAWQARVVVHAAPPFCFPTRPLTGCRIEPSTRITSSSTRESSGPTAGPNETVVVDLWDGYLENA
jgi:nitrile hydratase